MAKEIILKVLEETKQKLTNIENKDYTEIIEQEVSNYRQELVSKYEKDKQAEIQKISIELNVLENIKAQVECEEKELEQEKNIVLQENTIDNVCAENTPTLDTETVDIAVETM